MSRGWVFTVNNWVEEDEACLNALAERCSYFVMGKETGEQGTPHLQGYARFAAGLRKREVLGMLSERLGHQIHLRVARAGAAENRAYCTKGGVFTERGILPRSAGARSDLERFRNAISEGASKLELYEEETEMMARYPKFYEGYKQELSRVKALEQCRDGVLPEVVVLWGEPGAGKTREVFEQHDVTDIYKAGVSPNHGDALWWDGYDAQEVILLDDFYGQWRPEYMLNLLDRYPMQLNVKGSMRWRVATKIYITSNVHPREWYAHGSVPAAVRDALMRRLTTIRYVGGAENGETD